MNNLTDVLRSLVELHETLLTTAKKKQHILVKGEIDPLLSVLSEETKLVKQIKEADKARLSLLGEEAYRLSLADLIERHQNEAQKEEWTTIYQQLQSLFQEINSVNQENQQLLQQSLAFTQYMIEQMVPKSESPDLYSPASASKKTGESVRFFDAKA